MHLSNQSLHMHDSAQIAHNVSFQSSLGLLTGTMQAFVHALEDASQVHMPK
jgi:hypothetical protein